MNDTKLKQSLKKSQAKYHFISFVFFFCFVVALLFLLCSFQCPFSLLSLFFFLVLGFFLNCSSPLSPLILFFIIMVLLLYHRRSFTSLLLFCSLIAVVLCLHCSSPSKQLQWTMRESRVDLNERMEE